MVRRPRLDPEIFHLPVEKMREGYYSDKYFVRTRELLLKDDSVWPALAERSGMKDQSLMPAFIAMQRASFTAPYSEAKLAPTQALIAALLETVGQTPIGITSVDPAAFDFKSIEAAKGVRR